MPMINGSYYNVYVAFCHPRDSSPSHWTILLSHPGSVMCTWNHVAGGPARQAPYTFEIKETQRLNSRSFSQKIWITGILADLASEVEDIADSVPLQDSQNWTYQVILRLERNGFAPRGSAATYLEPHIGN